MSINNDAFAEKFTGELDKIIVDKSSVGFMTDNAFKAKFVGAKTVKIPSIAMQGLGNYNRDTGFISGTIDVSNTAYTMQMDRARSFVIDREDMDETGIAELAGSVMSEFVRTKVVPETDAYALSKLSGLAATRGQIITDFDLTKPYEMFNSLLNEIQAEVGMDEELVCFVNRYIWNAFRKTEEFSKLVEVGSFKQGEISFEVNKIDNVAIIPVSNSKMQTAIGFLSGKGDDKNGGFTTLVNSKGVYMLMLPKKAASLVKKSEKIRIFTPEQNLTADAYKFDYRIYYDVFVKNSYLSSVWAALAPSVSIVKSTNTYAIVTEGEISGEITFTAEASDGSQLELQWYRCDDKYKNNAVKLVGETSANMAIDTGLTAGTYYYFLKITAGGATELETSVCTVIVE
ncbi:MAG: hypothetical protein ACI39F_08905 [Acutalibacteraceae bacterium]